MLEFNSMYEFGMFVFRMLTATVFPVCVAIFIYHIDITTAFGNLNKWPKQIIIGIIFGIAASMATEFGIPVDGAVLNVRSAAPLTAGLLFGGPAGIISGVIGATHRWLSVYWGIGEYTRLACTLGTLFAGAMGALCREFIFNNKKTTWLYGFIIGVTTEVFHMLLVFLTKMDDIHQAFAVILKVSSPMIIANGIAVLLAMLLVSVIGGGVVRQKQEERPITQTFQSALLICVCAGFLITSGFSYILQKAIANEEVETLLKINMNSIPEAVNDMVCTSLSQYNGWIAEEFDIIEAEGEVITQEHLEAVMEEYEVQELHLVDKNGKIILSSSTEMIGQRYDYYEEFLGCNLIFWGEDTYIVDQKKFIEDNGIPNRYIASALSNGGFIISGYELEFFVEDIISQVNVVAGNRHIGQTGYIIIAGENGHIESTGQGLGSNKSLEELGIFLDAYKEGEVFEGAVMDDKAFLTYKQMDTVAGSYNLLAVYPKKEALFGQDSAIHLSVFMEILVFAILFMQVYFLTKTVIVKNIHEINDSLAKITGGNLEVKVNVRSNEEFASLSDDINSTVSTLKAYIAEAAARIDKELEFAKAIQTSVLPSVFPPYPKRKDFDIYASMRTAKEVGGDFYDFYLIDDDHLGFLIADVSGKGIPAAMFMMTSKTIIKGLAERGMEVNDIFTSANDRLCEGNDADMFVTAWMGILELSTGRLCFGNAGHNPPLLCHKDGSFEYLHSKANLALAFMEDIEYQKHEIVLQKGDRLYLYTDGVTEATNGEIELYGEERLQLALNRNPEENVQERCENIIADIDAFVGDAEQFDDITMLSVIYKGEP